MQVFDILILGQYQDGRLLTPRLRLLPGSRVARLGAAETAAVIEIPPLDYHEDGTTNVKRIGFFGVRDPAAVDEVVGFRLSTIWMRSLPP